MAGRAPWTIALAALAALAMAATAYPVVRTFAYLEINFNEGWNSYRAAMAANRTPLYGAPPKFTATNYPPLSFHFIGFIGKLTGDFNAAGRYVSLISLALVALLIAAIARRFSSNPRAGAYAALTFVLWLAIFSPNRIGMNDPQLLATVFGLAGLYAYVKDPSSNAWLCVSAVAFAVSLFTKHNLFVIPMAVGAHLILGRSWRRLAVWTGAFASVAAVLLLLTIKIDGPYFWSHMTVLRTYSYHAAAEKTATYLTFFQLPLAAAALWCWRNLAVRPRSVLVLALLAAHAAAFVFSGGFGIDHNIFFDSMIMAAIILAVALSDCETDLRLRRFGSGFFAALLLVPLIGPGALAGIGLLRYHAEFNEMPQIEHEFQEAVGFMAARPGRAFCETPLVCFTAGKPDEICMFHVPEQIKLGKLSEAEIVNLIQSYRFQSIEIGLTNGELVRPENYSEAIMRAIVDRYRIGLKTSRYAILIPNVE